MNNLVFFVLLVFVLGLIVYNIPNADALSIFDYNSCNKRFENLKLIGSDTYIRMFSNSEAARFCMSMFEAGLLPKVIKDHYEISRLGIEFRFT